MSAYERVLILDNKNKEAIKTLNLIYHGTLLKTDKNMGIKRESLNLNLNIEFF